MRVNSSPRSAERARDPVGVSDEPEADVLGQRRLDLVDDLLERAREARRRAAPRSTRRRREVRLGVLDDAPEVLQRRRGAPRAPRSPRGRPAGRRGRGSRRSAARVTGSSSAANGSCDRQRVARVGAGERLEAAARRPAPCARSARAPATGSTGRPARRRDPPGRRPQPDEVAERGRVADAGAEVGAVGEREHPGGDRGRRAAARPARRLATGPTGSAWRRRPR